jgi:hypothetical protein
MTDEAMVRQFVEVISGHVTRIASVASRGVLQMDALSPHDEKMIPHRFRPDDVDAIVKAAIGAANASLNGYLETRLVRAGLRGNARGGFDDTELVFGLVVDSDADKGKGGIVKVRPSLVVETSPGNFHFWYLFDKPVIAKQAKAIGDALRAVTGGDDDTGVVTQPYRIAGTPNFPSKAKQARGRTAVEPTRIVEATGHLWDPLEFLAAHTGAAGPAAPPTVAADESSLPDDLLEEIRNGQGKKIYRSRSEHFHAAISKLKRRNWSVDQIQRCSRNIRMA